MLVGNGHGSGGKGKHWRPDGHWNHCTLSWWEQWFPHAQPDIPWEGLEAGLYVWVLQG